MLNKHNLNIAKLASKDDSRFTLTSLLVTETHTVETDGHQLVEVSRPAPTEGASFPVPTDYPEQAVQKHAPFMLPASDAAKICAALPKKGVAHAAVCGSSAEGGSRIVPVVIGGEETQTHRVRVPAGNFPDYQRIVPPASKATFKIALSPSLLKDLMAQFESFTKGQGTPSVEFYFTDDKSPVRMDSDGGEGQHMTAVLMPIRSGFIQAEREKEAAKKEKKAAA